MATTRASRATIRNRFSQQNCFHLEMNGSSGLFLLCFRLCAAAWPAASGAIQPFFALFQPLRLYGVSCLRPVCFCQRQIVGVLTLHSTKKVWYVGFTSITGKRSRHGFGFDVEII
jgi:hypothetical protein